MSLLKKPGASLLLIGLLLLLVVAPIAGSLPLIGGVLKPIAWVVGLLGTIGGGYLVLRSTLGPGSAS